MTEKDEKVYCSKCVYLTIFTTIGCSNKNNIFVETTDTWFDKRETKEYMFEPKVINAHNDCSWFEKKEVVF